MIDILNSNNWDNKFILLQDISNRNLNLSEKERFMIHKTVTAIFMIYEGLLKNEFNKSQLSWIKDHLDILKQLLNYQH